MGWSGEAAAAGVNAYREGIQAKQKRRQDFEDRVAAALIENQLGQDNSIFKRRLDSGSMDQQLGFPSQAEQLQKNMQAMQGLLGSQAQPSQPGMGGMTMQGFSVDPMTGKMGDIKFGKKELTGEQQNRLLMLNSAFKDATSAKNILFPTGEASSQVSRIPAKLSVPFGATGDTEAQDFDSMMRNAVELRLRMETGAAAPASEVDRVLERYRPLARYTPEANLSRLDRFLEFVQEGQNIIDPSMRFHAQPTMGSSQRQGGQIMEDAQGNRAIVYPDGRYEEIP